MLARETSGYHSIETVFLRIDLGDDVMVREAAGRSLDVRGPAMPAAGLGPAEKNLAYRAADGVRRRDAVGLGVRDRDRQTHSGRRRTRRRKRGRRRSPSGAGRALAAPLGARLAELATPLGADVPFMTIDSRWRSAGGGASA